MTGAPAPVEEPKKVIKKDNKQKITKQKQETQPNPCADEDDLFWNYEGEKSTKKTASHVVITKDFPPAKSIAPVTQKKIAATVPVSSTSTTPSKKVLKPQKSKSDSFSYASVLSSPSSRTGVASVAPSVNVSSAAKIDSSQFPSLSSKKAPVVAPVSQPASQVSAPASFATDFPLPVKKSQSKNASKKNKK